MPATTTTTIENGGAAQAFDLVYNSSTACLPVSYSVTVSPDFPAGGSAEVIGGQLIVTLPDSGMVADDVYEIVVTGANTVSGTNVSDTWTLTATVVDTCVPVEFACVPCEIGAP